MPRIQFEPLEIGPKHALLGEFRRAFRTGPTASTAARTGDGASGDSAEAAGSGRASAPVSLLAIEGPRLIAEAIRSGLRVEKVLFSRTGLDHHGAKLLPQFSKHVQSAVAGDAAFNDAMEVENPQGVAAIVRWTSHRLEDVFPASGPALVAVAAGMQDPGNLGTLIRAADAFGATGVVALADTVSPFNAKAVRATAGSLFHLPVVARVSSTELLAACEKHRVALWATAARAEVETITADLQQPVCLVIGQEAAGVPREILRAAAGTVAIPMTRAIESLNAGVAGAILLYEASRQRRG